VARVVANIVFGLNHLAVKDLTLGLNAPVNLSTLQVERFEVSLMRRRSCIASAEDRQRFGIEHRT